MSLPTVPLGKLIQPAPVRRAGDRDFPVLSMTMRDGLVEQATRFKKRIASRETKNYRVVRRGELVVGFPIDEAVLAIQRVADEGIVSPAYAIWSVDDTLAYDVYLERFLRSNEAISYYKAHLRGTTARRRTLPPDKFRDMPVPLPSLEQQRRLTEIFHKADAIHRKRREALAMADSLLTSAFLDMFGDPIRNPKKLATVALGDLIKVSSGIGLTAKNMDPAGKYAVYGGNGITGYHSDFMFEEPQIVIGRVGVYCGAVHITEPKAWVTDNALYVREFKRPVNLTYLKWALRLANLNRYADSAAQPLISGSRIYPIEVVLPGDGEQRVFALVEERQKELRSLIETQGVQADDLVASISQRAFRGEL